jgi:hypothetical protein
MADDDIDDITEHDECDHGNGHDYSPAVEEIDLFGAAIALCQVAQRAKTVEGALKRLRKIGRDILAAERKRDAVIAETERKQSALAERAAELDERERAITKREDEFQSSIEDARDNLRGYYNRVAEVDRTCRYRIMASADLLSGYNPALQDLPSWDVLKRLVVGLPADPPAPAPEVVTQEVTTDWTGHHNFISGSTLTRTVRGTA